MDFSNQELHKVDSQMDKEEQDELVSKVEYYDDLNANLEDENAELREEVASLEVSNEELENTKETAEDILQQVADALCGPGEEADSICGWGHTHKLLEKAKALKEKNDELEDQVIHSIHEDEDAYAKYVEPLDLRDEVEKLKASQKQKGRIIKRLKENIDELKKTVDELESA
jgi:chromosome segregation ATPase